VILAEALDGRVAMGAGRLPPEIPISIEGRSRRLRDVFSDLDAPAAEMLRTTRARLAGPGSGAI